MDSKRLTGPQAGVLKYDLLTALAVAGLNASPGFQTSVLRLIALVTARYNWRSDELTVGQREMARLWACNERTVKREIKRLVGAGLLVCLRTGVKGRVGAYRLDRTTICRLADEYGESVGPDFVERFSTHRPETPKVVRLDFGKPPPSESDPPVNEKGAWRHVMEQLRSEEPSLYTNWYSQIAFVSLQNGTLKLRAKSRFIARYIEGRLSERLIAATEKNIGIVDRLEVTVDGA